MPSAAIAVLRPPRNDTSLRSHRPMATTNDSTPCRSPYIFLAWETAASMEQTVSASIRLFRHPRRQSFKPSGLGLGEEHPRQPPVRLQAVKQAGSLLRAGEPAGVAPARPAVGRLSADGRRLARPKRCPAVLREVFHAVVHPAKQVDDKVSGGHGGGSWAAAFLVEHRSLRPASWPL